LLFCWLVWFVGLLVTYQSVGRVEWSLVIRCDCLLFFQISNDVKNPENF
jgi:hypothetical protein